jgi:hypothetical protein
VKQEFIWRWSDGLVDSIDPVDKFTETTEHYKVFSNGYEHLIMKQDVLEHQLREFDPDNRHSFSKPQAQGEK